MTVRRRRLSTVSMILALCFAAAGTGAETMKFGALEVRAEAVREQIAVGEPVFIRVDLVNSGDHSLRLEAFCWDWELQVQGPDGLQVKGDLYTDLLGHRSHPYGELEELTPGESRARFIVLWFRSSSDGEAPWPPFFPEKGTYQLTLSEDFAVGVGDGELQSHRPQFNFRIQVAEPAPGYAEMLERVTPLLNMGYDVGTESGELAQLEEAVRALEGSPYADYVRWLWLKRYLEYPPSITEREGREALRKRKTALKYSRAILSGSVHQGSPLEREALTTIAELHGDHAALLYVYWERDRGKERANKALMGWYQSRAGVQGDIETFGRAPSAKLAAKQMERGQSILRELQRRFPPSTKMRRLQKRFKRMAPYMEEFLSRAPDDEG